MTRFDAPPLPRWLDKMLPFDRYVVEVENHRVHVMEHGDGPRTVLCVHGNPTWGFLYRKVAQALDPSLFRVIMPDLVGLGYSSRPASPHAHTLDNHGRWFGKLIDTLQIRDYIMVVQDWGGAIGLLGGSRAESGPGGLVLLNTVVGPPREGFRATAFHKFSQAPLLSDVAFRAFGFPQNVMKMAQGDRRSIRGSVARAYKEPLRGLERNAGPLALARMVPDSQTHPSIPALHRSRDYVTGFDGPISGVWGERDPILGSVGRYLEKKLLPNMRMIHTRAGHFLQEEVPLPIAREIEWVDSSLA